MTDPGIGQLPDSFHEVRRLPLEDTAPELDRRALVIPDGDQTTPIDDQPGQEREPLRSLAFVCLECDIASLLEAAAPTPGDGVAPRGFVEVPG